MEGRLRDGAKPDLTAASNWHAGGSWGGLSRVGIGGLLAELRSPPNLLTAARFVLVVVLWGFALTGHSVVVGVGLALAFLTDVLDGYLARRLERVSAFGSRFDSIVDGTVAPSAIAWILLLQPEVVTDHILLAAVWFLATYASLVVGLVRHRRFANLHLQSSRIACVAQYAFLVDVFVASSYSTLLLYLAAVLGTYSSVETLVLQLTFDDVDEHERSFGQALRRRRTAA
jgi:CDP-diacylglycerol--glycerol-3-phosphate 3-phosphatidyltransferase